MNAIREIKKVKNGKVEIELPKDFNGNEVEVIVLLNNKLEKKSGTHRKKAIEKFGGILKDYANPVLIQNEKDIAWTKVAKDKYDSSRY
ncbi:MAG: hypothetical protein ABI840_10260 [bacterium]